MPTLILKSFTCLDRSETDKDELYYKYSIDGGTPIRVQGFRNMLEGSFWPLDVKYTYNKSLKIELWDNDSPSNDDLVSEHTYSVEDGLVSQNLVYVQPDNRGPARYQVVTFPAI